MTLKERVDVYLDAKVFEQLKLYFGDRIQMAGCLVLTLGKEFYTGFVDVSQTQSSFESLQLYLEQ